MDRGERARTGGRAPERGPRRRAGAARSVAGAAGSSSWTSSERPTSRTSSPNSPPRTSGRTPDSRSSRSPGGGSRWSAPGTGSRSPRRTSGGPIPPVTGSATSLPLVSSSRDPERARLERHATWRRMTAGDEPPGPDLLLAYHRSHEPCAGPWSVCMHREDAGTVEREPRRGRTDGRDLPLCCRASVPDAVGRAPHPPPRALSRPETTAPPELPCAAAPSPRSGPASSSPSWRRRSARWSGRGVPAAGTPRSRSRRGPRPRGCSVRRGRRSTCSWASPCGWCGPGARGTCGRRAVGAFGVQLALNAAWSPVFFGLHEPGWAFLVIVLLWGAIVVTVVRFLRAVRAAGLAPAPVPRVGDVRRGRSTSRSGA